MYKRQIEKFHQVVDDFIRESKLKNIRTLEELNRLWAVYLEEYYHKPVSYTHLYWVFRIASYGFLAIISLITVLNITNSISMGVSARIKQYGAMRAVGMGSGQVAKMITAEAVTYAICGTAAGIILGLLLHYLIYAKIVITHFGGSWNIPFATIAIVLLLVVFSCIVAIYAPAKRIRNMAITATINEL